MLQRVSNIHHSLESIIQHGAISRPGLLQGGIMGLSGTACLPAGGVLLSWEQPHSILWGLAGFTPLQSPAPCVHFNEVHTFQVSRPGEGLHSVLHSAALRGGSLQFSKVRG